MRQKDEMRGSSFPFYTIIADRLLMPAIGEESLHRRKWKTATVVLSSYIANSG